MNRHKRAQQGAETVAILDEGRYRCRSGSVVDIAGELRNSVERTRVIAPDEWGGIVRATAALPERPAPAGVEVMGETTLAACRRLSGPFYKAMCKVTDEEFERAKNVEDHVVITESALDNQEVAVAFKPRAEWPEAFKFFRLYR